MQKISLYHSFPKQLLALTRLKVVFAFALFLLLVNQIPVAHADPHAVFYTATGQQQLFFNSLAALDQADYVEPAENTTGTGTGNSRQELLEQRTTAGFGPETDPALNATRTNLSSILTRGVTLEGNDLWSSYLGYQFALEVARRRNTDELLKVYCARGFGVKDCEDGSEPARIAEARKENAYVVDPVDQLQTIANAGNAVFGPALDPAYDQQVRQDAANPETLRANKFVPSNASITQLAKNNSSNETGKSTVSRLIQGIMHSSVAVVDSLLFSDLSIDSDKNVTLSNPNASIDDYTTKISDLLSTPNQLLGAQLTAQKEQEAVLAVKEKNGLLANTYAVPKVVNGQITTVGENISAPVVAKEAQLVNIPNTVAQGEISPYYLSATEYLPGNQHLVHSSPTPGSGSVEGIQSNGPSEIQTDSSGRVLAATSGSSSDDGSSGGIRDNLTTLPILPEQSPNPRNSNPVAFNQDVVSKLIGVISGDSNSGGCGCSVDGLVDTYGASILGR